MHNSRKLSMIGILLLIIGGIGAFITYPSAADSENAVKEFEFDDTITAVTVDADNSRIEILPATGNSAIVEFVVPDSRSQKYHLHTEVKNGVLEVEAKQRLLQFFSFDFSFKSFVTSVYLPENLYEEITAETANGTILIKDISASEIKAETTNGTLHFENLQSEKIDGITTNGMINFIEVDGELFAETTNGEIRLNTSEVTQHIDLETVNGKIEVKIAETPNDAEIRADVTNGKVRIFGEDTGFWTFGDGSVMINLKTVNGSVTVEN